MVRCEVCFRKCRLSEGQVGFCGGRVCRGGEVTALNYGKVTSVALDPIEKKPLNRFHPGSMILSVGSFGCDMRCPFCQNHSISWSQEAERFRGECDTLSPEQLAELALACRPRGNIGAAFTYNEPLIGFEYIRDAARLVREAGLMNVIVTNGSAELWVLEELLPYTDAMNIDLKSFDGDCYRRTLGGELETVKRFIARAVQGCHVELTTLIVPGMNDSEEELIRMTEWIASLTDGNGNVIGADIPLHISRFFPRFKMTDRPPTDVKLIYRLAGLARRRLRFVYTGNC
ncbi:MAG: AmmeMemoRadiSam system radical SAM enzyme [Ruminococcus sp.]|nr:AmmeMemoRadiSam system radical SAM enzyme [Ruminococcus sp.]